MCRLQAEFAADRRDRPDLVERVDLAGLGRLGDRHDARLRESGCPARWSRRRGSPPASACRPADGAISSFEPLEKNSGAPHSSVSTWPTRSRSRCGRTGTATARASELAAVPLKAKNTSQSVSNSARKASDARGGPEVVAIGRRVAVVGLLHRRPGLGADAGIIVAGELLGFAGHSAPPSRLIDRTVQDAENCASIKAVTKRGIAAVRSPTPRTR